MLPELNVHFTALHKSLHRLGLRGITPPEQETFTNVALTALHAIELAFQSVREGRQPAEPIKKVK